MSAVSGSWNLVGMVSVLCFIASAAPAVSGEPSSPALGYDIHVQAPHLMPNGEPGGPYHHYCKGISDKILQCLLFESTDPKAPLVAIEYFVAKDLTRKLPAIQWHRHFHDHKVEIATGRVQVLEPADKAKEIAEAASATDGVIYHLWQKGLEFPDGSVSFPNPWDTNFRDILNGERRRTQGSILRGWGPYDRITLVDLSESRGGHSRHPTRSDDRSTGLVEPTDLCS